MSLSPRARSPVKTWLIAGLAICLIVAVGLFLASLYLMAKYQPAIRELAVSYLQQHFDGLVESS